ncbi:MAG: hypothetical protein HDS22_05000 [Bacteroides sp.]|nr:hypothetical protein [Bacteroides sp.]
MKNLRVPKKFFSDFTLILPLSARAGPKIFQKIFIFILQYFNTLMKNLKISSKKVAEKFGGIKKRQ